MRQFFFSSHKYISAADGYQYITNLWRIEETENIDEEQSYKKSSTRTQSRRRTEREEKAKIKKTTAHGKNRLIAIHAKLDEETDQTDDDDSAAYRD